MTDDALFATAQVVEQVRPHGGPAQAGAVAHGFVDVLDRGSAAQHEVELASRQSAAESRLAR